MIATLGQYYFLLVGPVLLIGLIELAYYPLALAFEVRRRREVPASWWPKVSVIVPAYNEGRVIAACVESILADDYADKEVILVDDGSTDNTLPLLCRYLARGNVTVLHRPNGGKAAALNAGIERATGEVLVFVDADGLFTGNTIGRLLNGFTGPDVGAVCGNDEPANLDRVQTRLLALLTHGTAFARRALASVNLLTIVSGNIGAFRRSVLDEIGTFREGFIGEDLELTWRAHRAGYRVAFRPDALVYAEVPSTAAGLWKQRVRWTRGLAQTALLHRDLVFSPRHGRLGWYLPYNVLAMLVLPVLQVLSLLLTLALLVSGDLPLSPQVLTGVGLIGAATAVGTVVYAIALDRAWRDLRFLYVLPLWTVYSLAMSLVVVRALLLEAAGAPSRWNKLERTGVIDRQDVSTLPVELGAPAGRSTDVAA
ncbi:glycosyltransferase [Occultella kanbiaonis]|uniref:glycosyltransferase n=1 Tax=Occultella kanbiaonis TaxID=2675754 RepID=UPI001F40DF49|nr:glycosyltransferase family 2 protein [Occultella kanbiaonis]